MNPGTHLHQSPLIWREVCAARSLIHEQYAKELPCACCVLLHAVLRVLLCAHDMLMTELYPLQVFAIHVFSAGSVPNRL